MKNRKYIAINLLSAALLLFGAIACTDDMENNGTAQNDGAFRFSAGENVYTRATTDEYFTEGTKYQLFAIDQNTKDWTQNFLASNPNNDAVIGTENSNHTIDYTGNNKFNGRTLNFYGVTASSQELLTLKPGSSTDAPTIDVKYPQSGSLPDILWATKEGQTYNNSGTIQLPFIHTLSKLNLLVQKHEGMSSQLAIKKIELCDYTSGLLNLSNGEFESSSETRENNFYTVFEGSQILETTSAPLKKDGKNVEPTIFPTRSIETTDLGKHSLGIKVTMSNGNIYTYWTKEVALDANNQPIKINGKEQYRPFPFKPNYEYDVQLTITESAMVVTILPRVYDWIPKEETQNNNTIVEVGNPVTFGGVTWMDRNLGATSADPTASEMDWERSRGFFYQFGRSIPYYIKGSMQDPDYEEKLTMNAPTCKDDSKDSEPFPYIAEKYHEKQNSWSSSWSAIPIEKLAISPTDDDNLNFNFVFNTQDNNPTYRDWDETHEVSASRWKESKNDPCPKGWRLPTSEEFKRIFPIDIAAGDITFNNDYAYEDEYNNKHMITHSIKGWLTSQQGGYQVFREVKNDGVYIGINDKSYWGTIYAIKNQGKSDAYRIKWSIEEVGESYCNTGSVKQKRTVLVISRYPATSEDNLTLTYKYGGYTSNHTNYDWEHPSEVLKLPIAGYIHADSNKAGLIYAGCETIYWTSDIGRVSNTASSVRIKIRGGSYYKALMRYDLERRGYGCLIRCVRDNSVKE